MKIIKNIASFIYPVMVDARTGDVTPHLRVEMQNGKYLLNSDTVNYSFGSLHLIFDQLFKEIDVKQFDLRNILILGMGAGSIIHLLREKYKINCPITAIEKDKVVIELATKYFNIRTYNDLTIINEDAFTYTSKTKEKYNLIISDLFIDEDVPEIFSSNEYLMNLKRISTESSCVIYNKMTDNPIHQKELGGLYEDFERIFPGAEILKLYDASDCENSLLYYNTLPVSIKERSSFIDNSLKQVLIAPRLKPSF